MDQYYTKRKTDVGMSPKRNAFAQSRGRVQSDYFEVKPKRKLYQNEDNADSSQVEFTALDAFASQFSVGEPRTDLPLTGIDRPFTAESFNFSRRCPDLEPFYRSPLSPDEIHNLIQMLKADNKRKMKREDLVYDRDLVPTDLSKDLYLQPGKRVNVGDKNSNYYSKLEPFYQVKDRNDLTLVFESRFESGNLKNVFQIDAFEYNLYISGDHVNNKHHQWFYFSVANTRRNQTYRFNILNNDKKNSNFQSGMKPLVYSVKRNGGWTRSGNNIYYFQNNIKK